MKIGENTLSVLKNFANMNASLVLRKGNIQRTINNDTTVLVEAEIEDSLPMDFGIYDLNQFLATISAMNDPELDFTDKSVIMNSKDLKMTYYSCSINLIKSPPDKELMMKRIDAKFSLTNNYLQTIVRLASINQLPHVSFIGKNGEMSATVHDRANDTSNSVVTKLGSYDGPDLNSTYKVEYLKLVPEDYDAEIMTGTFMKLINKTGKLKYFIAEAS